MDQAPNRNAREPTVPFGSAASLPRLTGFPLHPFVAVFYPCSGLLTEQSRRLARLRARAAIANQMIAEESNNARIEVAMKGDPVEARWISAKPRQVGRELRRAGWQERKVTCRYDADLRIFRQAAGSQCGVFWIDAPASQFRAPDLQRNPNGGQACRRKHEVQCRVGKNSGPDSGSCAGAGGMLPLRNCSQPNDLFVSVQIGAIVE